jgi:hypothetical protein
MKSPADNIATILHNLGVGVKGKDIFIGRDPALKKQTITCYDMGGAVPNPKYNRNEPRVKIVVSGNVDKYAEAYTKAKQIKDLLLGADNILIGTDIYFAFRMTSDIASIGYDDNNRPMFSINMRFLVDGPDEGNRVSL